MNKKLALAAGAGVVLAAWAGATFVTAQRVQGALVAQADGLKPQPGQPVPGLRVTGVTYERGLLRATRTLTLAVGCGPDAGTFTWRDDIRHGPLPGFAGFGAARIDSQLVLSPEQQAKLKALLGEAKAPMTLRTLVAYGGAYKAQLDVPALRTQMPEGGELEFQGASAWVQVRADGSARYEATMPRYAVTAPGQGQGPGLHIAFTDVKAQGEGFAPLWWALSGKGSGSVGAMTVETVAAGGQRQPLMALKNLRYTQDGSINGGMYQASVAMEGNGQIGPLPLEALRMKFSMKQLDAQAYAALLGALLNTGCPAVEPDADPMAAVAPLLAPLQKLLPQNPQMSMDELSLTLSGLTAKMDYQVGVQGLTAEEAQGPNLMPALMQKMRLGMGVEAPLALLPKLAEAMGRPLPPELLDQQLAQAEAQGMVVRTGDKISARFELRDGSTLINGKPMAVPGLPAPQGAAPAGR